MVIAVVVVVVVTVTVWIFPTEAIYNLHFPVEDTCLSIVCLKIATRSMLVVRRDRRH